MKLREREQEQDEAAEEEEEEPGEGAAEGGRIAALKADVNRVATGAAIALEVAGLKTPTRPLGKKKVLVSGLLSLVLGPFGWFYAAPLKEAIPVALGYALVLYFVPSFLLFFLVGAVNLLSMIAGLLYAWGFNSAGKRVPLVLKEKGEREEPPLRKYIVKKK
jgi:hypothetical protein